MEIDERRRVCRVEPSARKPTFPADPVAQTAAIFAALAAARGPITADALAGNFRKTKTLEKSIFDVLESLARLSVGIASRFEHRQKVEIIGTIALRHSG